MGNVMVMDDYGAFEEQWWAWHYGQTWSLNAYHDDIPSNTNLLCLILLPDSLPCGWLVLPSRSY